MERWCSVALLLLPLAACTPDYPMDKQDTWQLPAVGSNEKNLRVMLVNPQDLVAGTGEDNSIGAEAAPPSAPAGDRKAARRCRHRTRRCSRSTPLAGTGRRRGRSWRSSPIASLRAPEPAEPPAPPSFGSPADRKVLAFVRDEESAAALRSALSRVGEELDVRRGGLRHAIRYFPKQSAARIVIVDISGEPDAAGALDDLAKVCAPSMQVIVVGENRDVEFYRLLVNDLGVAEYLPKPLTRDTIQRVVLPRLEGASVEPANVRGGQVIVVCSARGGAGATTIAVNAALELVEATKANVALLHLHLQDGTAALMLSARLGPGLRIALEDAERGDALLLERTAIEVAPRLRLLAAEEGFGSNAPITEAGVARVLALLRQKFNYVIIDLPIPPPPEMFGVLALARQVVVVFGPDIGALRDAKALRNLINITTGADRVIAFAEPVRCRGLGLPKSLIESGLGKAPDIIIPDLGKRMLQALNLGVPARKRVLALRRYLAPLVQEIAGVRTNKRGWSWLRRRRRK